MNMKIESSFNFSQDDWSLRSKNCRAVLAKICYSWAWGRSWIVKKIPELLHMLKTTSQLSSHDKMRTIATATKMFQLSNHETTWITVTVWLDHQSFTDHSTLERVWPIELSQLSMQNKIWTTVTCWLMTQLTYSQLGHQSCKDLLIHDHFSLWTVEPIEVSQLSIKHKIRTTVTCWLGQEPCKDLLIHDNSSLWTARLMEVVAVVHSKQDIDYCDLMTGSRV